MSSTEMGFVAEAFELIDDLETRESPSLDVIRTGLLKITTQCGYGRFTITRLPHGKERLAPLMIVKEWPADWLIHYDRSGFYRHDPVGRHCFRTIEPFDWNEAIPDRRHAHEEARVMREAAEHGLRQGMCIPVHSVDAFQAVVSLAGERVEASIKMRKALHLVGIAAFGAAIRRERVGRPRRGKALSARERDVLTLTAIGETAGKVADRLGLSPTTVRSHLAKARIKLETVNTVHTVLEAYRRREISP